MPDRSERPARNTLPAISVREFRQLLDAALADRDDHGRRWADARWGCYAFYDYDGEPIYVGQTNERLRTRVRRHLTTQRTDAVAMRILDVFEVAELELQRLLTEMTMAGGGPMPAGASSCSTTTMASQSMWDRQMSVSAREFAGI